MRVCYILYNKMRRRKLKKIGGSLFIQLYKADVQDFGLIEGEYVDIDDLNLIEQDTEAIKEECCDMGVKEEKEL